MLKHLPNKVRGVFLSVTKRLFMLYQEAVRGIHKTVLSRNQYCIVLDPVDEKCVNQLGKRELRVGVTSFFLHPGEVLEAGIQEAYVLADDEALVLSALDYYKDDTSGN